MQYLLYWHAYCIPKWLFLLDWDAVLPHHFVQFSSLSRAESYEGSLQLHIKGNWSQSVLLFCTTLSLKQRAHTADVHYVHYVHSFKLKLNSSMWSERSAKADKPGDRWNCWQRTKGVYRRSLCNPFFTIPLQWTIGDCLAAFSYEFLGLCHTSCVE